MSAKGELDPLRASLSLKGKKTRVSLKADFVQSLNDLVNLARQLGIARNRRCVRTWPDLEAKPPWGNNPKHLQMKYKFLAKRKIHQTTLLRVRNAWHPNNVKHG